MRVLIIGNLAGQLSIATKMAFDKGAKVLHADDAAKALDLLRTGRGADIVMIDVHEDITGLVAAMKQERIVAPVVACGVNTDAGTAANAIRAGAREFIPLPPDPELIAAVLAAVADDDRPMIAMDSAMVELRILADQIAPSDASVLITGESGVGKEVMARYVHKKSRRADKPFISVNCAAIPENLLESELFGHEKGAFTGAVARRIGKFEEADGGTLLLDEISEMDVRLQAKLLRAIQEREIDRVGGAKPVPVNIRIIATSNRILQEAVLRGDFREDLLYRLNLINIHLPPLRDRRGDIQRIANHFLRLANEAYRTDVGGLTPRAVDWLKSQNWPGNIRQLRQTIDRAVLIRGGRELDVEDFFAVRDAAANAPREETLPDAGSMTLDEMEKRMIVKCFRHYEGNVSRVAEALGISRAALYRRMEKYGIAAE